MATYTQQCSSVGGYSYAKNYTLYVTLNDRDGNSETNRSYVDYNVYAQSNGSGWFTGTHRRYFSINGSTIIDVTQSISTSSPNGYVPIASGTIEVTHNDDGSKTIPFSAQIQASNYGISANISGDFTLNRIDRYAKFSKSWVYGVTLNTADILYRTDRTIIAVQYSLNNGPWNNTITVSGNWNEPNNDIIYRVSNLNPNTQYTIKTRIQNNNGLWTESPVMNFITRDIARLTDTPNINIGETHIIKWNNPGNAATSLKLCTINNDIIEDFGDVTGNQIEITPTANKIYPLTPNSNTLTLKYVITSKQNNKSYTADKECIFTVTDSNPTFSNFEYEDVNSITLELTGDSKTVIKGHSTVRVTISPTNKAVAKNYATMSKYRLSIGDKVDEKTFSDTEDVVLEVSNVENNTITVYAIDSRENSVSKQILADNYIPYESIKIATMVAHRSNNVGAETTISFDGYIWNSNFGKISNDIVSCTYKYKKTTDSEWTEGTTKLLPEKIGNSFSLNEVVSGDLGAEGFDIDESYNLEVYIADKLTSNNDNPATFILGPGIPAIAIYKNSVAIGQKYDIEDDSKFQIKGKTHFKDTTVFDDTIQKVDEGFVKAAYVLYENESGSTGTITLALSAENFDYIEIFYNAGATNSSTRIYSPNGKSANLKTVSVESNNITAYLNNRNVKISGTTISTVTYSRSVFYEDSNISQAFLGVYITKVIGYK